jgi:uncharacterized protein (TIGR03435 family)
MPEPDDIALLKQYADEYSESAFAELVARYVNLVYSVALRSVGNAHAAQEITQAVFIILARKADVLPQHAVLSGWLYQTARLTAANYLRGEIRRQKREQEAYMQSILNEPESEAWRQISPMLDDAMGRLGGKDRNAIVLRFFENKNLSEVGVAMGASEDAAKMRVNRALEKLRKFFTKRGVALSGTIIAGAVSANSVHAAPVGLAKTISAVAIAKGAAASGSTLTLIKGALKIMAWTKAKTALVACSAAVLATGTTTVVVEEIISFNRQTVYEAIFEHPDASSIARLEKAPAVLIVRPTRYPGGGGGTWTPNGKGVFVGASLSYMLCWAYGTLPTRMMLPPGAPGGKYDYLDTLPNGHQEALRAKIKKQFGLIAHTETRDTDVLLLKIKDETSLQSHRSAGGNTRSYIIEENQAVIYHLDNETLSDVARSLEGYFEKPVISGTGSTTRYTFEMQWPMSLTGTEGVAQTLQEQLDQLGFELVPTNMPIEILVAEKTR